MAPPIQVTTSEIDASRVPNCSTAQVANKSKKYPQGLFHFPSSGCHPLGALNHGFEATRLALSVENNISGSISNERLIEDYFPHNRPGRTIVDGVDEVTLKISTELHKRGLYGEGNNGDCFSEHWIQMPDTLKPKFAEDNTEKTRKMLEVWITKALIDIINTFISVLGLDDTRRAIDCQSAPIRSMGEGYLKPDIFIWGEGTPAFPNAFKAEDYSACHSSERVEWPWCVLPIEVKTTKGRGSIDNSGPMSQLATYAREVFAAQPHRRFVPSLLFTDRTWEFIIWDRAGILRSPAQNYHTNPNLFYHMLLEVLTWTDDQLGFGKSEAFCGSQLQIVSSCMPDVFNIEKTLLLSYSICSRGSTCWQAATLDKKRNLLIQDSWSKVDAAGREKYCVESIRDIQAQLETVLCGIPKFVHFENLTLPDDNLDSIYCGRKTHYNKSLDTVHTRTIWELEPSAGEIFPLDHCASVVEVVKVLNDVVQGLRYLFNKYSIVHRDITIWNIIFQRKAEGSVKGFIMDFSCATSFLLSKTETRSEITPGSQVFMSRAALLGQCTTYVDDLESILYVLYWIAGAHTKLPLKGNQVNEDELPHPLESWISTRKLTKLAEAKSSWIRDPLPSIKCCPSFKPLRPLINSIRSLLATNDSSASHTIPPTRKSHDVSPPIADEHFADVIRQFSNTLLLLETLEVEQSSTTGDNLSGFLTSDIGPYTKIPSWAREGGSDEESTIQLPHGNDRDSNQNQKVMRSSEKHALKAKVKNQKQAKPKADGAARSRRRKKENSDT